MSISLNGHVIFPFIKKTAKILMRPPFFHLQVLTAIQFPNAKDNALKYREEISKDVTFISYLITAGSLLTVGTSDKGTNMIITFSIREVLFCICLELALTLRE
jgi:hypothetical protein